VVRGKFGWFRSSKVSAKITVPGATVAGVATEGRLGAGLTGPTSTGANEPSSVTDKGSSTVLSSGMSSSCAKVGTREPTSKMQSAINVMVRMQQYPRNVVSNASASGLPTALYFLVMAGVTRA
jgi:hypothetical protein